MTVCSSTTTVTKKSDAGTFSHHFLHNRSVVRTQGKRKEVAWTLRVGMSEVLTLLPLGSAAGEWAKTFKKILPYMYQFQESRDWRVIKRCLVTEKQYLVSGRNPFYCPSRMVMSYRPLLQLLITLLHSSYLGYHIEPHSTLDPFICQHRGKTSSKRIFRVSGCACLPVCLLFIVGGQGNHHPVSAK